MTTRASFHYFRPERLIRVFTETFEHINPLLTLYYASMCSKVVHEIPWNTGMCIAENDSLVCVFEGFGL